MKTKFNACIIILIPSFIVVSNFHSTISYLSSQQVELCKIIYFILWFQKIRIIYIFIYSV